MSLFFSTTGHAEKTMEKAYDGRTSGSSPSFAHSSNTIAGNLLYIYMLFFFPTAGHAEKSMKNPNDGRTMGSSFALPQARPLTPAIEGTMLYIYVAFLSNNWSCGEDHVEGRL
jgi:hypothetical protein